MLRKNNTQTNLLKIAWEKINNKKINDALDYLGQFSIKNDAWYDAYARCLLEQGLYPEALEALTKLERKTKNTYLSWGRYHNAMNNFDEAIRSYQQINGWENDRHALLGIALT